MTWAGTVTAGVMVLVIYYMVEDRVGKALYALSLGAAVVLGGYLATKGVG